MHLANKYLLVSIAAVMNAAGTAPADAAVRVCENQVGGRGTAPSETEAKKRALADWKERTKAFGENFGNWSISNSRRITCATGRDGAIVCIAEAQPCIIDNAPNTLEIRKKRQDI